MRPSPSQWTWARRRISSGRSWRKSLREQVGEGEIHDMSCTAVVQNGLLTVTLKAECVEEIVLFVPKSGDGT